MVQISNRLRKIKPSATLAITAKAKELKAQGIQVISLSAGEPDFDTPDFIKKSAIEGIQQGCTKYTEVGGTFLLKQALQQFFQNDYGISYTYNELIVNCGAKQTIYNAFMASLNTGDEVIIPAPYWVSYPDMVILAGGTPVILSTFLENDFSIDPEQLEKLITNNTRWLILNAPNNPTGKIYTKQNLEHIAAILRKYPHVMILCDDIYHKILYTNTPLYHLIQVAPDLKERILLVNGVSKAYAMTGWRIGFAAGNRSLIQAMEKIQSQSTSNPSSVSQVAATAALTGPQDILKTHVAAYQERCAFVIESLEKIQGLHPVHPEGAFYIFVCCAGIIGKQTPQGMVIKTDQDFVCYLLEEAQIAVVPGVVFGMSPFFRLSYATDMMSLQMAMQRLAEACRVLR